VRRRYRLRLGVLAVSAAVPVGLLVAAGASGAKVSSTVALKIRVTGSGRVWVTGKPAVTCRAASCSHTFHVRRRQRIVVNASPRTGWKLTKWAGACKGSSETCSLRLGARRSAGVAFAPPGDPLNPYPLGTAVTLTGPSGSWQVKINSATSNTNPPPPAGWQYTIVNLTMTYAGSGSATPAGFLHSPQQMWAEGPSYTIYPPDGCAPPQPDLDSTVHLSAGESATGNLCYEIHTGDAGALLLSGHALRGNTRKTVWFALR